MKEREGNVRVICLPSDGFLSYTVSVINSKHEIVYRGCTSKRGIAAFPINAYDEYEVRVESPGCMYPRAASRWVKFTPRQTCGLYFVFSKDIFMSDDTNATFHLTDQYYRGLPISKGELYLCPNLM